MNKLHKNDLKLMEKNHVQLEYMNNEDELYMY